MIDGKVSFLGTKSRRRIVYKNGTERQFSKDNIVKYLIRALVQKLSRVDQGQQLSNQQVGRPHFHHQTKVKLWGAKYLSVHCGVLVEGRYLHL